MRALERRRRWLSAVFGSALGAAATLRALAGCHSNEAPSDAGEEVSCVARPDIDATYLDPADVEICPVMFPCGIEPNFGLAGCAVVSLDTEGGTPIGCNLPVSSGCEAGRATLSHDASVRLDCFCDIFQGGGRRPAGWRPAGRARAASSAGLWLASLATEEAASVGAFERLSRELARHRAPPTLVAAARRAACDERRHARVVAGEARRFGAEASLRAVRSRPVRALEAVARENARQGCVRETYGALLARWQAERAADPRLRAALGRIAVDEARHAALAWAVADWADERLRPAARRRVARARRAATRDLARRLEASPPASVARLCGLPTPSESRALLASLLERIGRRT